MIVNEVDKFRNDFFEKLIKEEKEKERTLHLKQKNCHHDYSIQGHTTPNGYQSRSCSKCGHEALKSLRVWQGTANGTCIIA
jgi:hypothetical protein